MNWLLVFIPIGLTLDSLGYSPMLVFLASALAIVPLAKLMGDATQSYQLKDGRRRAGLVDHMFTERKLSIVRYRIS